MKKEMVIFLVLIVANFVATLALRQTQNIFVSFLSMGVLACTMIFTYQTFTSHYSISKKSKLDKTLENRIIVRHIVAWTLHDVKDSDYFKAQLESCRDIVPGILQLEIGMSVTGLTSNCHVVLNSTFTDKAALDAYQIHPQHLIVKENVAKLVAVRQVMDYYVPATELV